MCSPSTETETWTFSDVWFVLTISKSHFLPVSVTASSTMVKLQPLLSLHPPSSPHSLDLSFKFYGAAGDSPLLNAYSVSLSLSLSVSLSLPRRLGPIKAGLMCLLSPTPFIPRVPPGSCWGWTLAVGVHRLHCSVACGIFPAQRSNLCPLHWPVDS